MPLHLSEGREVSPVISAEEALERLKRGNRDFVTVRAHERDLSTERIEELYAYGQNPFAVVVACSDSRTVPEHMFMMGLGDLFVVRTAGNAVGQAELASVVYACEHLGVKLVLVVGHTGCGAIQASAEAAERGQAGCGVMGALTAPIIEAIGDERDPYRASELNVRASMSKLAACPELARFCKTDGLRIAGAVYHTHSGVVDFLE